MAGIPTALTLPEQLLCMLSARRRYKISKKTLLIS